MVQICVLSDAQQKASSLKSFNIWVRTYLFLINYVTSESAVWGRGMISKLYIISALCLPVGDFSYRLRKHGGMESNFSNKYLCSMCLAFHLWESKSIFILQRTLPLEKPRVLRKLLKGHQGQDQGHWRPWPLCLIPGMLYLSSPSDDLCSQWIYRSTRMLPLTMKSCCNDNNCMLFV